MDGFHDLFCGAALDCGCIVDKAWYGAIETPDISAIWEMVGFVAMADTSQSNDIFRIHQNRRNVQEKCKKCKFLQSIDNKMKKRYSNKWKRHKKRKKMKTFYIKM